MKQFEIPAFYRSSFIGLIKESRRKEDPRKKIFTPTTLDFGPVRFHLGRHFGFCYGVENAIEIAYSAIEENPNKQIFMLSQMIHNPTVNHDLNARGLRFILDTEGNQITPWEDVKGGDIVIIPAFGTTLEMMAFMASKGLECKTYNTTCPFVEKVWKTAEKLGSQDFTIIIHGKFKHEETQATFSHSKAESPSVVIKDINEAKILGEIILKKRVETDFQKYFGTKHSLEFDPKKDLNRVGVINQTTMLASETHEISDYFKSIMIEKYGLDQVSEHFADTRDTLCYATNDNQQSTYELLNVDADLAIVVGGYNSSNTSHIKDLCDSKFQSYFINGPLEILNASEIRHFDYETKVLKIENDFLPKKETIDIVLTSGASCPDSVVEQVIERIISFFPSSKSKDEVLSSFNA